MSSVEFDCRLLREGDTPCYRWCGGGNCLYPKERLFISYWRCNRTKTIRIMRHEENATPSKVAELKLIGKELTDADVANAEALLVSLLQKS